MHHGVAFRGGWASIIADQDELRWLDCALWIICAIGFAAVAIVLPTIRDDQAQASPA